MVAYSPGQRCICSRSDQHLYWPAGQMSCSQVVAPQDIQTTSPGSTHPQPLDAMQAHRLTVDTAKLDVRTVPSASLTIQAGAHLVVAESKRVVSYVSGSCCCAGVRSQQIYHIVVPKALRPVLRCAAVPGGEGGLCPIGQQHNGLMQATLAGCSHQSSGTCRVTGGR